MGFEHYEDFGESEETEDSEERIKVHRSLRCATCKRTFPQHGRRKRRKCGHRTCDSCHYRFEYSRAYRNAHASMPPLEEGVWRGNHLVPCSACSLPKDWPYSPNVWFGVHARKQIVPQVATFYKVSSRLKGTEFEIAKDLLPLIAGYIVAPPFQFIPAWPRIKKTVIQFGLGFALNLVVGFVTSAGILLASRYINLACPWTCPWAVWENLKTAARQCVEVPSLSSVCGVLVAFVHCPSCLPQ